jgi:hypothetical protein
MHKIIFTLFIVCTSFVFANELLQKQVSELVKKHTSKAQRAIAIAALTTVNDDDRQDFSIQSNYYPFYGWGFASHTY